MAISRKNIDTNWSVASPKLIDGTYQWFGGGVAFDNTYMAIITFAMSPGGGAYVGTVTVDVKNDDNTAGFSFNLNPNFPLIITIPDAEEYKIGGAFRFQISGSATLQATSARLMFTCFNNSGDSIGIQS